MRGKEIYNTGRGLTPDIVRKEILESKGLTVNKDILTTAINRGNFKFHYIKDTKSEYIKLFELIDTKESNKEGNSTYEEVFIKE